MRKIVLVLLLALFGCVAVLHAEDLTEEINKWVELTNQGNDALRAGQLQKALEFYLKAEKALPERTSRNAIQIGRAYYALGQFDKAVEYLERAEKIMGEEEPLYTVLTMAYHRMNNLEKAAPRFEKLCRKKPNDITVCFRAANDYYKIKNYQKAREMGEATLKIKPNDVEICNLIALSCNALNDSDCAIQYWEKAFALDPSREQFKKNAQELRRRTGK